jgi:hypothetical protein
MQHSEETAAVAGLNQSGLRALHARMGPYFRRREARERALR